ncbi:Adenylate and Guanylate cyclase catalytic domain containing protein [Tritrichomonas foetus]|uniref:Adenylate and Guanylate cyclase catalytic domain containing protein n=1 Tax=Tritrichomonas foetus TaxID=1144522 RepID=A0A1J4KMF6_9EUKA|nr:Adenylate and Guanylate cyclase catalytic domain containing protein [Tritrichomonas foetus]|eukprot:OHT12112.1 Adenylate and Guanylate cyclase catalytic domain containing protein [Tritrichomonas foetus]
MKVPDPSSTAMMTSSSFQTLDFTNKYNGLIDQSSLKKTRYSLYQLFDYVSTESPPFFTVHMIISIWRLLQFFGPATCSNYVQRSLWGEGTVVRKAWNIISIVFYIVPASEQVDSGYIALYVFSIILIILYVFVGYAAYIYSRHAKLPSYMPPIISLCVSTFGYIIGPIITMLSGVSIGSFIRHYEKNFTITKVVAVCISLILIFIYMWFYRSVYSITIIFRPDSLTAVSPITQVNLMYFILFITFVSGIASRVDPYTCFFLTLFIIILYGSTFPIYFSKGGFVSEKHTYCLIATSCTSMALLIFIIISLITRLILNEFIFIGIIVVYSGFYFLSKVLYDKFITNNAKLLDLIEEDQENIEVIRSVRKIENLLVIGFRLAHPFCISFEFPQLAVSKYPKEVNLWVILAKFTAIYPEETQQLTYITVGMSSNKLKGPLAKHTQQQIQSIMRLRETNLLPAMKSKLEKVGKQVQATKHKIRYIWDLIIQGNVKELESVVHHAHVSIDSSEAEFLHLLRQFPNSRFVARAYARFLRDVVADHAGHKQWAQNVSILQRGFQVAPDQAHDLGIRAFPLLPSTINGQLSAINNGTAMMTEDTLTQDIDGDEEHAAIDAELRMSVRDSINNLSIPSYRKTKIFRLVSFFIIFLIPVVIVSIFLPIYLNDIMQPLSFMYYISSLRTKAYQIVSVSLHYIMENLNATNPDRDNMVTFPFARNGLIYGEEEPPISFGGFYDSDKQLRFLIQAITTILPNFKELNQFKPEDPTMSLVRECIFEIVINFTDIKDPVRLKGFNFSDRNESYTYYPVEHSMKSAQDSIVNFIINMETILDIKHFPADALNMRYASTPINNVKAVSDTLSSAMNTITNYLKEATDIDNGVIIIGLITIVIIIPIYYSLSCVFIISKITKEKLIIYRTLTSLPKNIVSKVADSFKVLKKEEDEEMRSSITKDEEVNKQEENLLKIFSTSTGSSRSNQTDMIIIVVVAISSAILHACITVTFCIFMYKSNNKLDKASPHVDYITASYASFLAAQVNLFLMPGVAHPYIIYRPYGFTMNRILVRVYEWLTQAQDMYKAVRYGDIKLGTASFEALGADLDGGQGMDPCNLSHSPTYDHQVYGCWTSDSILSYSWTQFINFLTIYKSNNIVFAGNNPLIAHLYHMEQVHIYDNYFYPLFEGIVPMVVSILNSEVPTIIGICYGLLFVALLLEIFFFIFLISSENRQKFALRLLLHCPGNAVVSNMHIAAILSGDFSSKTIDSTNRDDEFYDILVKELPDSILILDSDGKIISANNATYRIFGVDVEALCQMNIIEFGLQFKGDNPFKDIFDKQEKAKNFEKALIYQKIDQDSNNYNTSNKNINLDNGNNNENNQVKNSYTDIHVEVTFIALGENYLVSSRDVTQTVMYNKLISDEKSKSDRLLASILPAKLVSRVQAGEKNISFAVQSVSILFLDIVSFTPWCGSLPAATVMKTLNMMFKEFDSLVSIHHTMTKVKCIGDCYMAAGGIFAEINQPSQHAKDVVEFGLEAIQALEQLNEEINQKLQIRVGINTGGPIVAGVLGTEKPTFEILGPTINMAQQMEHHGVPMKVHISRAVYELIYGGSFDVKERGEIEIKNGKVITYVVSPKSKASK